MTYRPHIDGLRAVAIVPVVAFHAGSAWLGGGFVGVDVFFVISGYLITSLIAGEIRAGRFSVLGFYERRVRRLFPALFTVLACSSVAAALILAPESLRAFGRSALAAALFFSNVLFWSESGYFEPAAEMKPLLHTWSLAVEEQFYLAFPLVLLLAHRLLKDRWALAVGAIGVLSLVWSVAEVSVDPASAFYLAQFRIWELMLGALAALGALPVLRARPLREAASALGLALVAGSVVAFSRETPFPGAAALLPCLGALLLIHSGGESAVGRFLSLRPVVFVGLISYPLYLWHWPMLVFARRLALRDLGTAETAALVAASVALAAFTWRFVEQPIRSRRGLWRGRGPLFANAAAGMALAVGFGLLAASAPRSIALQGDYVAQPIRGREDYRVGNCLLNVEQPYAEWAAHGPCVIDNGGRRTVLVWGDSFAAHYTPGLESEGAGAGLNFVLFSAGRCPPVLGVRVPYAPHCADFNSHLEDILARYRIDSVVVAARWERYWKKLTDKDAVERTVERLRARGLPVVLVGQGPSFEFQDPAEYVFRTGKDRSQPRPGEPINKELRSVRGYSAFFDPGQYLCAHGHCPLKIGGEFVYYDDGHYSSYGSRLIAGDLVKAIAAAMP